MGILLKLLFSDSKEQLNVIVEDYDRATKRVLRTMLDVMVDLESKQKNVSDIDECSNEDLNSQNFNSWNDGNDELEKVLGEELGIEISNITGNAVPFKVTSSNDKSDSTLAAVVSMAEKCTLTDRDEEDILNADFSKISVGNNVTNPDDIDLVTETNESDEVMVEACVLNEDSILSMSDTPKNNDTEKTQSNSDPSTPSCSKNRDPSTPPSSKNKDLSTPSSSMNKNPSTPPSSKNKDPSMPSSSKNKDPSTPSASKTSNKKDTPENSKSPKKIVTEKSNSSEEREENESDCEFVIEEVLDFDYLEEVDDWSGDGENKLDDPQLIVDLTDRENIDPLSVRVHNVSSTDGESCCGSDRVVTIVDDFSDDDDACSQYSSARLCPRRRARSDAGSRSFDGDFVPFRRAMSDPPEDRIETVYDDDDEYYDDVQVVDLTSSERDIECVDLTNEKASSSVQHPFLIRRSPRVVMNQLRNFYSSNREMIAAQKDALRELGRRFDSKNSGVEAPAKLSNGLPRRKRCSTVTHESDIKFSRTSRSSGLSERNVNSADESSRRKSPLNRDVPRQTCGPPGFRVNVDYGVDPVLPKEEESASRDSRYSNPIPSVAGRTLRRQFSHRGNRRGRSPLITANTPRFHRRVQGERFFKPYRRMNGQRTVQPAQRTVQPTPIRGEVWLDLKS